MEGVERRGNLSNKSQLGQLDGPNGSGFLSDAGEIEGKRNVFALNRR